VGTGPQSSTNKEKFLSSGRIVASPFLQHKSLLSNQNVTVNFNQEKSEDDAGIQELSMN